MTKRCRVFSSVLAMLWMTLAGCAPERPELVLPKSISPGWQLTKTEKLDSASAPDIVREAHPKAGWIVTYTGPGTAHARVWATPQVVGLDLVQRWRAQPNTVVFSSDRYFAAIDWADTGRPEAGALVQALERALR